MSTVIEQWVHTSRWSEQRRSKMGPQERDMQRAPEQLRRAFNECASENTWPLFIHGPAGTGKSCFLWCLFDIARSPRYYTTASDLAETTLHRINEFGQVSHFWRVEWPRKRFVFIDEIGARSKVSDYAYDTLKRAIDGRHGLPLVCASNLTLKQIAEVYDDRVSSRLAEGRVVSSGQVDRRLKR